VAVVRHRNPAGGGEELDATGTSSSSRLIGEAAHDRLLQVQRLRAARTTRG
jgi:hypothetical protein